MTVDYKLNASQSQDVLGTVSISGGLAWRITKDLWRLAVSWRSGKCMDEVVFLRKVVYGYFLLTCVKASYHGVTPPTKIYLAASCRSNFLDHPIFLCGATPPNSYVLHTFPMCSLSKLSTLGWLTQEALLCQAVWQSWPPKNFHPSWTLCSSLLSLFFS